MKGPNMTISKKSLPRRTFLRGLGVTVALPLLDAMVPAFTPTLKGAARPVRRLGFVYIPNGAHMPAWTPSSVGAITELPTILQSLAPFRDHTTVITNLEHRNAYGPGNHLLANSTFLSAVPAKMTEGSDYQLATTVDQIAVRKIGDTALPSLELSTDFNYVVGTCDNGYNCVYMNTLSWSSPTSPMPTEANPRLVFERLFGDGGSAAERRAEMRKNRSILDQVTEAMGRLRSELGPGDRTKVSEYLDTVREVERRIANSEKQDREALPDDLNRPMGVPSSWEEHVKLMFDLQVLALQADITRVITFQLDREASGRTYSQIGVPDPHHATSHHQNDQEKFLKITKINAYHMSLFAYFLDKLQSTRDGDGTLLDHSLYLYGGGISDGNLHNHLNLPVVVVGGAAGAMKGGRHIAYAQPVPMANLLLTMLDKIGAHEPRFGDSNGRVDEL
jgi:hypothetical protein